MDAKAKAVAYGLWHERDKRMGNFIHNDIESAEYRAADAAKHGYVLMPLVTLTDHEAALAEKATEFTGALITIGNQDEQIAKLIAERATLVSGLEALAEEMFAEGYSGKDEARGPIYNYANAIKALLASSATGGKNTEEELK